MDDPIFDPWAIGEMVPADDETSPDDARGVGQSRETEPVEAPAPVSAEAQPTRRWVLPAAPVSPAASVAPAAPSAQTAPAAPRLVPDPTSGRPLPQPLQLRALQGIARPRLEELQARLHVSSHGAVLADLTDRETPSLRLRFVPRRGAFDEPDSSEGAVLEMAWNDEAGHVAARFWLDPLAEECTEEVTAPPARVDRAWVDRVILEFVGKALRASP